jgi:glycosyltransferase involved in cell wall biosynthesis
MRLAIITWRDTANPLAGGAEMLIDNIARIIQSRGHDVTVICGGPTEQHPYNVINAGGTYTQYLRVPWIVRRLEKRYGVFDLLIDVENGIPFFSPLWHRHHPNICLVHHVHTDQWSTRFSPAVAAFGRFMERTVMPLVYKNTPFVAVSPSTASALVEIGIDRKHIVIIENGVSAHPVAQKESNEPLFVAIGRLVPHKQIDIMLEAWKVVRRELKGGRLLIVGSGPEYVTLASSLPPGCELLGHVDEDTKWKLLEDCWMLIHTAHHEGWGMVILEAASVGKPSVALDAPGVRDAIINNVTGILCSDTQDLEEAWTRLARDSKLRHILGSQARDRSLELSWGKTAERYIAMAKTMRNGYITS